MHKAQVRAARMVKAAWREKAYRSELIEESDREVPYFGMTDEEWAAQRKYWTPGRR